MGWSVRLNEEAERDLEHAVTFLAAKSPIGAEKLGLGLVNTIFSLAEFPHRGGRVVGRLGCRRVLHPPWFVIFYRVDETNLAVEIIRIWDARQNPEDLRLT